MAVASTLGRLLAGAAPLLVAALAALSGANAHAQACGRENGRPCGVLERIPAATTD